MFNDNAARLVERYLTFKEGIAYGIDQLLEPPGLGAHCDTMENRTTYVSSANTITFVMLDVLSVIDLNLFHDVVKVKARGWLHLNKRTLYIYE